MPTRLLVALLTFTLVVGVAAADPGMGRSPGKGRGYSRDRHSHSSDGRKSPSVFTSALQQLQKSIAKHKSGMSPQPGLPVVPTPAARPETPPAEKSEPEPAPVVNPVEVPNPLADVKPVIAATAEDDEAEDETPPPLSGGAIAAIIAGIAFGMLLLVGLTVMIVHQRRATPRYRRARRRGEDDHAPTDV